MTSLSASAGRVERDWDGLQYRAIFAICLPACVCAAGMARLKPNYWRGAGTRRPLLAEAWEATGTTARIALAG